MDIQAGEFKGREDLENHVRGLVPLTPEAKPGYTIKGKRKELARLRLSDRTVFYGIRCVILDTPTQKLEVSKPQRGEIQAHGLDKEKKVK